jgi:hypothetical protein
MNRATAKVQQPTPIEAGAGVLATGDNGNGGHQCPYFGQTVPYDWSGCSECGVAQDCYDTWVQTQPALVQVHHG